MARIISGRGLRIPILFDLCIFINSEIVSLLSLNFHFMGRALKSLLLASLEGLSLNSSRPPWQWLPEGQRSVILRRNMKFFKMRIRNSAFISCSYLSIYPSMFLALLP